MSRSSKRMTATSSDEQPRRIAVIDHARCAPGTPAYVADEFNQVITLNWTAAAPHGQPLLAYEIEGGGAYLGGTPLAADALSYAFTYTDPLTSYSFRVRARNSIGWGDWSPFVYVGTAALVVEASRPLVPSMVEATALGPHLISATWESGGGGDHNAPATYSIAIAVAGGDESAAAAYYTFPNTTTTATFSVPSSVTAPERCSAQSPPDGIPCVSRYV